jgi:hypothetical protein
MEGLVGVTSIETRTAAVTVSDVVPLTPVKLAEMVALPTPVLVARPLLPAASEIAATAPSKEAQVT